MTKLAISLVVQGSGGILAVTGRSWSNIAQMHYHYMCTHVQ